MPQTRKQIVRFAAHPGWYSEHLDCGEENDQPPRRDRRDDPWCPATAGCVDVAVASATGPISTKDGSGDAVSMFGTVPGPGWIPSQASDAVDPGVIDQQGRPRGSFRRGAALSASGACGHHRRRWWNRSADTRTLSSMFMRVLCRSCAGATGQEMDNRCFDKSGQCGMPSRQRVRSPVMPFARGVCRTRYDRYGKQTASGRCSGRPRARSFRFESEQHFLL